MRTVILWGVGELGGVFARGLLRAGHSVVPVTRSQDPARVAERTADPDQVLIAVGENDLGSVLARVPRPFASKLAFVQNEILPRDWQKFDIARPTMIVVWFEKKPGRDVHVVLPSQVHGPGAGLYAEALSELDIPVSVVPDAQQLLREMVVKNVYILTVNIAGLQVGGTTGALWEHHRELALCTAREVIALQKALSGQPQDEAYLLERLEQALLADPEHGCTGRTAPARLARALERVREHGLEAPTLERIAGTAQIE